MMQDSIGLHNHASGFIQYPTLNLLLGYHARKCCILRTTIFITSHQDDTSVLLAAVSATLGVLSSHVQVAHLLVEMYDRSCP